MTALKKIAGPRTFLLVGDSKLISYANAAVMAAAQVAFVAPLAAARVPAGAVGRLADRAGTEVDYVARRDAASPPPRGAPTGCLRTTGWTCAAPQERSGGALAQDLWCSPRRTPPTRRPALGRRPQDRSWPQTAWQRRSPRATRWPGGCGHRPRTPRSWTAPPAMAGGCRRWRCCAGPAVSTGRTVGMGAPRLYMAVAMILVIIKIAQLAIGHQVPLHREHGPHSGARHRPCGHRHEGERSWPRHRPGPDASSRFCGGARTRRPGSACRHQAGLLRAALHAAVHAVATAGRRRGHGRSRRAGNRTSSTLDALIVIAGSSTRGHRPS